MGAKVEKNPEMEIALGMILDSICRIRTKCDKLAGGLSVVSVRVRRLCQVNSMALRGVIVLFYKVIWGFVRQNLD